MDAQIRFVEQPQSELVDRRRKVWLECNGEPYDYRAVHLLGTGLVADDIVIVNFDCPRCGKPHQSLLFA